VYWFNPNYQNTPLATNFVDLASALKQPGKLVTRSPLSEVSQVTVPPYVVYVKKYCSAGKSLRRYFGRSRNRFEWENLKFFRQLKIAVPNIIAYGEKRKFGFYKTGIIVTEAVKNSIDLAELIQVQPELIHNGIWLKKVMRKIAVYTKQLHNNGFIHNDLKWRNILVNKDITNAQAYFIDCPSGRKRYGWMRKRGIVKDLACLDKIAKRVLSRSQRLRFYYYYAEKRKLSSKDKQFILKIINFFSGRE